MIRKLNKALPQHSIIAIYKSFVRPHLGYGYIIYDQPNKENLNQKIERIQYNATLAITGAIKGAYQGRLYSEWDPESLKFKRWFRKRSVFYKIQTTGVPQYHNSILQNDHLYDTCVAQSMWQHFAADLMLLIILSFSIQY